MLRRSTSGPCASLACGATSAVMRRVASLLMSCSSSSDMPCPGNQPLGTLDGRLLHTFCRADTPMGCMSAAVTLQAGHCSQEASKCIDFPLHQTIHRARYVCKGCTAGCESVLLPWVSACHGSAWRSWSHGGL